MKKNPKKPTLEIENPTIYVGDTTFNPDDYVRAFDEIDGEISFKQLKNTIDIYTPGRYMVVYSAKNSNNLSTSGIEYVTVIEKPQNTPPTLFVQDQSILQYDPINYFKNSYATDIEDGDLSNQIQITKYIDTSKVGIQEACYIVYDSEGLSDSKCVNITVREKKIISALPSNYGPLRFVSSENPFVNENYQGNWNISSLKRKLSIAWDHYISYY